MPRTKAIEPPTYGLYKPRNLARVVIDGRQLYLGTYGTAESRAAYDRTIATWLANGRRLPLDFDPLAAAPVTPVIPATPAPAPTQIADDPEWAHLTNAMRPGATIGELILAYTERWVEIECTATKQKNYRLALDTLNCATWKADAETKITAGLIPVSKFGPLSLQAVRTWMLAQPQAHSSESRWTRQTINNYIGRIKRMFKWATQNELIPGRIFDGLRAVGELKYGKEGKRVRLRENRVIEPVADEVIMATLPHLNRHIATMIRVMRLSAARMGELCVMKPCDIEMTDSGVWAYHPEKHKNAWRGQPRTIALNATCQTLLRPFLAGRKPDEYVFQPAEALAEFRAEQRANRKRKLYKGDIARYEREAAVRTRRTIEPHYQTHTVTDAITKACDEHGIEHWHVHQVRHTVSAAVELAFGSDEAR